MAFASVSMPALALLAAALAACVAPRAPTPAVHAFARCLALVCLAYIALQRPVYPNVAGLALGTPLAQHVLWAVALGAAALAPFRPVLLLVPGYYLLWVKAFAAHATGFPYDRLLDVQPLSQLATGTALLVVVVATLGAWRARASAPTAGAGAAPARSAAPLPAASIAADALLFMLVSFHLAGYLFSGVQKATLDGGFWFWPLVNSPIDIYFAGVINAQLPWQELPGAVELYTRFMDAGGRASAIGVFAVQLAAFSAFAHRRWAIGLLLAYDVLHLGIFVSQGANFVTWVLVNLCVIAALRRLPDRAFGLAPVIVSATLMCFCQFAYGKFYRVPNLGWYDTLAVNNAHFLAETADGALHRVPSTFFGFYSYPVAHMSFGLPPGGTYVPTNTNGGTVHRAVRDQAGTCDFTPEELVDNHPERWDEAALAAFLRAHHRDAAARHERMPPLTSQLYWHHFWPAPSIVSAFADVRLDEIVAYVYTVEATCIGRSGDVPAARVLATERVRIPL